MMTVNLKGTFVVAQLVLPDMIEAGGGQVVNNSSSSVQSEAARMADYSASEGGVIALTRHSHWSVGDTASRPTASRRAS